MEVYTTTYTTTYESVVCACGGRHNNVPATRLKHRNTQHHLTWMFERLIERFLTLTTQEERVASLKKQRAVYQTGKVK